MNKVLVIGLIMSIGINISSDKEIKKNNNEPINYSTLLSFHIGDALCTEY